MELYHNFGVYREWDESYLRVVLVCDVIHSYWHRTCKEYLSCRVIIPIIKLRVLRVETMPETMSAEDIHHLHDFPICTIKHRTCYHTMTPSFPWSCMLTRWIISWHFIICVWDFRYIIGILFVIQISQGSRFIDLSPTLRGKKGYWELLRVKRIG